MDQVAALDGVDAALGSVTFRSSARPTEGGSVIEATSPDNVMYVVGTDLDRAQALRSFDLVVGALPARLVRTRSWWPARSRTTSTWPRVIRSPWRPRRGARWPRSRGSSTRSVRGLGFQGAVGYTSTTTAQRMLGKGDVITGVEAALADGVDTDAWIAEHRDALGQSLTIQGAEDAVAGFREVHRRDQRGADADVGDRGLRGRLPRVPHLLGGGRGAHPDLRHPARAGGRPAQVRRVVLTEAGVLGLAASLVGLVVGRLIAGASLGLVESLLALDLPSLGLPVAPALAGVVVGVSVSLAAAWLPGRRAAAFPPSTRCSREPTAASAPDAGGPERCSWGWASRWGSAAPASQCAGSPPSSSCSPRSCSSRSRCGQWRGSLAARTSRLARGTGSIVVLHLVKERSRERVHARVGDGGAGDAHHGGGERTRRCPRTLTRIIDRQAGGSVQVIAPGAFDPDVGGRLAEIEGAGSRHPRPLRADRSPHGRRIARVWT